MTQNLIKIAKEQEQFVINTRRDLHKIPEIGFEEEKTISYIKDIFDDIQIHEVTELKGGLMLDFIKDPNLPLILFRADIDGLPIQENTNLPYSSQHPGFMHACGHDTHAAMLLGAIKAIMHEDISLTRNIRFIFQRAEENPSPERDSGGHSLVNEGILKGVSEVFALHIWALGKKGVFMSRPGRMFANSDRLKINITCTGGHVAMPDKGSNAIDISYDIYNYLKGAGLRLLGANQPLSMMPAICNSGTAGNIMPASAELWYSSRHFLKPDEKQKFYQQVAEGIEERVKLFKGASVKVEFRTGHPTCSNSVKQFNETAVLLKNAGQEVEEMEFPII